MEWPLFFKHALILGNLDSNVAICTLWSEKEKLAKEIQKEYYCLIGNLYSKKGIEYIIKNTLANPKIRYIILFGEDLTGSGEELLNFMEGKDLGLKVDKKYQNLFRKQVEVKDLRKVSLKELIDILEKLNSEKLPPFGKPIFLKEEFVLHKEMQSEDTCFTIRESQIANAWLQILDLIMKFGEVKKTQYGIKSKELSNTIVIIEDEKQEIKPFLNISKKEIKEYIPSVLSSNNPIGVTYTYGERLFSYKIEEYKEVNQIEYIISLLKKIPYTRRAIAITWNVEKDRKSEHPPCLIYHHFLVRKGKLFLTCVLRSNDMFKAFPLNAFALHELLKLVCKETNLKYGKLIIISNSAHIYESDWEEANKILEKNRKFKERLILDPRGYFIIYLENGNIVVEHFTNDDEKSGYKFVGKSAKELYKKIIFENLVSRLDHAAYLGKELSIAEFCLKNNIDYKQDKG